MWHIVIREENDKKKDAIVMVDAGREFISNSKRLQNLLLVQPLPMVIRLNSWHTSGSLRISELNFICLLQDVGFQYEVGCRWLYNLV